MLEPSISILATPNTEWIFIVGFFIVLMYMYYRVKDYFVIVCTTLIGSFLLLLGMSYSGITEFDLLLSIELGKFKKMSELVE